MKGSAGAVGLLGLLAVLAAVRDAALEAPGPAAAVPARGRLRAGGCSSLVCARVLQLRLRGGRAKEHARFDARNEELALEYLARQKGQSALLDQAEPDDEDGDAPAIGVPEQVRDEEAESKRRSMVRKCAHGGRAGGQGGTGATTAVAQRPAGPLSR